MEESRDTILVRLEELSRTVSQLQSRVASLEHATLPQPAQLEPQAVRIEADEVKAVTAGGAVFDAAPNLMPLFGWAVMGIAGAYLLRTFTESGGIAGAAAAAAGILYAAWWLYLAARRASERPVYSTVHALTAALILVPMLWEMTIRFHLISAASASVVVVGFALLGMAIGWKQNVTAIGWIVTPAALLTACALFRETHDASLWTVTLLIIAAAVEMSAFRDHWLGLRWIAAIAADLCVVALAELATRAAAGSEFLAPIRPGAVAGAQIALLTIYLAGTVGRTIFRGLNITWFEIGQAAIAFAISMGGALRFSGSAPAGTLSVGLFCLLAGSACYVVSFAFLDKEHKRDRNFHTYSTFGALLIPLGCAVLLSGAALVAAWSLLAVLLMLAGLHGGRDTLRIHAALYLLLGVWHSSLMVEATSRIIRVSGGLAESIPAEYVLALAGAASCYAVLILADKQRHWLDDVELVVMAALVVWGTAGLAATWTCRYLSPAAPIRTAMLTALAIAAAWAGARWSRAEITRLAYPLLALAGIKLLAEDLQQGQSLLLVLSLIFCGSGLILLPRLMRR
ncbi:hypothetical protein [Paludibaculum fermentans]|uniref:DUF2339 domain-containing protein n=1 Tax=Paludibaculum fermentans TaxID=1473598 RepID=A0A7S7NTE2_PALFE|nr:hypothetical protein [Paludibaculum fermentans]QOY88904.1 hypothetical protein IRI77_02780 [Paludibaculum fermentans]